MNTTQAPTTSDGHVIERLDSAPPLFFSRKIGRDFGQPNGGWTGERDLATVMTIQEADQLLESGLANDAPFCKVVRK